MRLLGPPVVHHALGPIEMKWYIAVNEISLTAQPGYWDSLIKVAMLSAKRHTRLTPHMIYDGADHPIVEKFRAMGGVVVPHRVSFYDALEKYGETRPGYLMIASGAFLRTEIPLIEQDDVILYTDCDVMFSSDIDFGDLKPDFFACAPEFDKEDYTNFNTGVMFMNLKALRTEAKGFSDFIRNNLDKCAAFDQGAYRIYFEDRLDKLPIEYNWKPYWGVSDTAHIVHFHGPKPQHAIEMLAAEENDFYGLRSLFNLNTEAYRYYLDKWLEIKLS